MTHSPDLSQRHPEIQRLHNYFAHEHLPTKLQAVSRHFGNLADLLLMQLPDSPELTACLRKLLEAKDCAVRCALEIPDSED
jgi:hypothetical protein